MKSSRETHYTILGLALLLVIVLWIGAYVRGGGSYVFPSTSLAAVPASLILLVMTFALRKADKRTQLIWCIFAIILLRSVQLWKAGIDFRDELRFIDQSRRLFEQGQFLGYLRYYPMNIPFAAVFYGLFSVWPDVEVFETLALLVYPLLVLGYSFMASEISKMKTYKGLSPPVIPAILFLPFAPTFSIIPTYYWPQLLGLVVLFFAVGSLLRLINTVPDRLRARLGVATALSVVLVLTHSISSALYILTVLFFWIASRDRLEKRILVTIGLITTLAFAVAHLVEYWSIVQALMQAVLGDAAAWRYLESYSFPDFGSVMQRGIPMTIAHTGFFLMVSVLVIARAFGKIHHDEGLGSGSHRTSGSLSSRFRGLVRDPILASFICFGAVAFLSATFLGGNFLDPVRLIGWACLLALPIVAPRTKFGAFITVVVLLFLFFLLVWTVNSPWGSPLGSSLNLNDG